MEQQPLDRAPQLVKELAVADTYLALMTQCRIGDGSDYIACIRDSYDPTTKTLHHIYSPLGLKWLQEDPIIFFGRSPHLYISPLTFSALVE
jgi:hypothetical protein